MYYRRGYDMLKKVEIHVSTTCPYCKLAKAYLDKNRVAYDEFVCQLPLPEGRGLEEKMLTTSDQPGRKAID